MSQQPEATPDSLLRLPEVRKITGLSRSTIYELQSQSRFPQSIKITDRSVAWIESEVRNWIAHRVEQTRARRAHTYQLDPEAESPSVRDPSRNVSR